MKLSVINGKVLGRKQTHVSAPSPAEIAGMAYDRAVKLAVDELRHWKTANPDAATLENYLAECRTAALAALREEVINRRKR